MEPAAALSRKKKIRAGHRATVTRTLGEIATALSGEAPDLDRIARLKLTLNEKLETLNKLDSEIIELTAEEGLESEIQQSDENKEKIYEALTRVNKVLDAAASPKPVAAPAAAAAVPGDHGGAKVKLPKITLPHFNGNVMKWSTFWDSYESAVHKNKDLSDVDKFNYLRSLLERSAYDAIAGLTLSAANYKEAIEILEKRFGNKQMIIAKHMETLLNVEAVTSDNNLKELRHLYDTIESHIRSLKSLGVESASYGAMLSSVLLLKLPPDLRLIVSRDVSSDTDLSMENLMKLFERELIARERASNPSTSHSQGRRSHDKGRHSALLSGARETGASVGFSCCYCQQQHSAKDCATVTSISARKQILRNSGRCFNCLRKGHVGRLCRSMSRCQKCKGRHHTSICEAQTRREAQSGEVPSLAQAGETANTPRLNPSAAPYAPTTTTNNPLLRSTEVSTPTNSSRHCAESPETSEPR